MLSRIFGLFAAVVIASATVQAQSPGKVDLEVASALIGAAVFAADDEVVGHVFELVVDDDAQPQALRISTGALIGFGARTVEVPKGAFRIEDACGRRRVGRGCKLASRPVRAAR